MAFQTKSEECTGCTVCAKICPTNAIHGERNQVHQINPDLCISCGACGNVCRHTAILNDELTLAVPQTKQDWLIPVWNEEECVACNICLFTCPTCAISLNIYSTTNNFRYAVDPKKCIGCGFCSQDCPITVIDLIPRSQILAFLK